MADVSYRVVDGQGVVFIKDREGSYTKVARPQLADLLESDAKRTYLKACAAIDRSYTDACRATNDPCLESGCSMDVEAGEICLQPVLRAGEEYDLACVSEWMKLFKDPQNRVEPWRSN